MRALHAKGSRTMVSLNFLNFAPAAATIAA
jgi:hypothetical protein